MACNDASGTTKPVEGSPACNGALPGVYDMVGNVFEWENGCSNGSCRARGGDYASPQTGCSLGTLFNAAQGFPDVGFRCCIDE
jgi:formylglycine-generating enzyme required for sulfatase activity